MSKAAKSERLSKVAKKLNVGMATVVDFLNDKGFEIKPSPNTKISPEQYAMLAEAFEASIRAKKEAREVTIGNSGADNIVIDSQKKRNDQGEEDETVSQKDSEDGSDEEVLSIKNLTSEPASKVKTSVKFRDEEDDKEPETIRGGHQYKVVDKIDLDAKPPKKATEKTQSSEKPDTVEADTVKEEAEVKTETVSENQETILKKEEKPEATEDFSEESSKVPEQKQTTVLTDSPAETPTSEELKKEDVPSEEKPVVTAETDKKKEETEVKADSSTITAKSEKVDKKSKSEEGKKASEDSNPEKVEDLVIEEKPQTEKKQKIEVKKEDSKVAKPQEVKSKSEAGNNSEKPKKTENKASGKKDGGRKRNSSGKRERKPLPRIDEKQADGTKVQKVVLDQDKEAEDETPKETIKGRADQLQGLKVLGKIELPDKKKKKKKKPADTKDTSSGSGSNSEDDDKGRKRRRRRRRRRSDGAGASTADKPQQQRGDDSRKDNNANRKRKKTKKAAPTEQEVQEQIKQTMAKIRGDANSRKTRRSNRRERREAHARAQQRKLEQQEKEAQILKVTEFVSANELANMMSVSVNEVISKCLTLGVIVSINQRLEADTISLIADEFGYEAEFTTEDDDVKIIEEEVDAPEDLSPRAPIVTIMGHVDHGKTTLLDFIRNSKIAAGEAGGITQHIGAYNVETESGKRIAFLDTPGHEAFTAMRARGAKITDVAIIVVAADDGVMPQTREAINHAQVAEVPIVIAINKMDKPGANPEKIKQELADLNLLVEDWGGKYQCQEISAKSGQGVDDLLESVLLEAEMLELKANPDKKAVGTVVEASLDRGRGYVATLLVQAGTLRVGDVTLAGAHFGKVRAMLDHKGNRIHEAGPSTPVQILGLDGAPQAGDRFNVMETDREAREIASKREQILREQTIRATKRLTLSDIGRRRALGNFQQLNLIVKGDVDGSVEALSDSLLKLSSEEIEVNIIHKGVGQISESDVLLASASECVIIGFQVRPSKNARQLAEKEKIEVRLYSIIYKAIEEVKDAIVGMLAPKIEEVILGNVTVRDVFKISRVGTIAGCYVTDGTITRKAQIRLVREGIVTYAGEIDSLKRFKEDVNEVKSGFECGISIKNFNDIKVGDEIEAFEEREIARTQLPD